MKYKWIRKPDFKSIQRVVNYNDYWSYRGWEINKKLKNREIKALDLIPKGSKVIDIGCGNSLLPLALKEKGVDVHVGDVSDKVLQEYSKFGVPGRIIDLENIKINS